MQSHTKQRIASFVAAAALFVPARAGAQSQNGSPYFYPTPAGLVTTSAEGAPDSQGAPQEPQAPTSPDGWSLVWGPSPLTAKNSCIAESANGMDEVVWNKEDGVVYRLTSHGAMMVTVKGGKVDIVSRVTRVYDNKNPLTEESDDFPSKVQQEKKVKGSKAAPKMIVAPVPTHDLNDPFDKGRFKATAESFVEACKAEEKFKTLSIKRDQSEIKATTYSWWKTLLNSPYYTITPPWVNAGPGIPVVIDNHVVGGGPSRASAPGGRASPASAKPK